MSARISKLLLGPPLSLPRHMPFRQTRGTSIAPWSVVQHYELWPTPLLDLTASLRVAASFALGLADGQHRDETDRFQKRALENRGLEEGMLYAFAVPEIVSDVMTLIEPNGVEAVAVRLSAVCPHDAMRPHLQEGYLVGRPTFDEADLDDHGEMSPAMEWLSAVFHLKNENGRFFDSDFPRHSQAALLPERKVDPLLDRFRTEIRYSFDAETKQCRLDAGPAGA